MQRGLVRKLLICALSLAFTGGLCAETRSAQDMAKECRVALDVAQGRVEKTFENTLFLGECIGYVQGAADVSLAMADNVKWFKMCVPESTSTMALIQKFIAFVDKNPKYILASTSFQLMLGQEFPCRK
jgi:Rap1a immunity proteins